MLMRKQKKNTAEEEKAEEEKKKQEEKKKKKRRKKKEMLPDFSFSSIRVRVEDARNSNNQKAEEIRNLRAEIARLKEEQLHPTAATTVKVTPPVTPDLEEGEVEEDEDENKNENEEEF
jgi:hypothetical protein